MESTKAAANLQERCFALKARGVNRACSDPRVRIGDATGEKIEEKGFVRENVATARYTFVFDHALEMRHF